MHRQITEAADQWEAMDRDPGALYRGTRLARGMDWAASHPGTLNEREMAFMAEFDAQAARDDEEREAQHARELEAAERLADAERRRAEQAAASAGRLRRRAIALSGALGLAAVLGVVALAFGQQARVSLANADSQRLGAEANGILQRGESAELAALLAIRGSSRSTRPRLTRPSNARPDNSSAIASSPLPQRVDGLRDLGGRPIPARGSGDGDVRLVEVDERRGHPHPSRPVRLRPRRRLLARRDAGHGHRHRPSTCGTSRPGPSAGRDPGVSRTELHPGWPLARPPDRRRGHLARCHGWSRPQADADPRRGPCSSHPWPNGLRDLRRDGQPVGPRHGHATSTISPAHRATSPTRRSRPTGGGGDQLE